MQKLSERAIIHHFLQRCFSLALWAWSNPCLCHAPFFCLNDFDWLPRRVARPGTNQTLDLVISVQLFDKKSNKSARVTIVPDPDSLAIIFSSSSRLLGFIGHFQIFCLVSNNFVHTNQKIIKKVSKGKRKY